MASDDQRLLLRILDERDISLGPEIVASVFEDAQTRGRTRSWMHEYLTPTTLLTKDELDFYNKRGISSLGSGRNHQDKNRSFCADADIESAIKSLETSTAAIEAQCKVLESQKLALRQIQNRHSRDISASTGLDHGHRKLERQRAQIDFSIDELSQSLVERIKLAAKQADSWAGNISSNADRIFDKDDRLLDGLQKLLPILARPPIQNNDDIDIRKLCTTLIELSAQEIRARLNAAYLDSLVQFKRQTNGSLDVELTAQQQKQSDTLRTELGELSKEIDGLVSLVVDHKYRSPIIGTQESARADSLTQRSNWGEYMIDTLQYISARLDKLNEHVQHIHAHQAALRAISGSLDEVNTMQPPNSGPSDLPGNPRSSSKGLKPLRLVQANLSEPQDPAIQLLRQLDVRTSEIDDLSKLEEHLDPVLQERQDGLFQLSKTSEMGITDAITNSLSSSERDFQPLARAVQAYSISQSTELVDGAVAHALQSLENDTQRLSEDMRELDTDHIERAVRAKQEKNLRAIER